MRKPWAQWALAENAQQHLAQSLNLTSTGPCCWMKKKLLDFGSVDLCLIFRFVAHVCKKLARLCLAFWYVGYLPTLLIKCLRWSQAACMLLIWNILPPFSPISNRDQLPLMYSFTNFPSASVQLIFGDDSSEYLSYWRFSLLMQISSFCRNVFISHE